MKNKDATQAIAAFKSGDRKAAHEAVKQMNANTERKRANFRAGSLGMGGRK